MLVLQVDGVERVTISERVAYWLCPSKWEIYDGASALLEALTTSDG